MADAPSDAVLALLDEGARHVRGANLGAALDSYSRAVAADPRSSQALSNRAIVQLRLGQFEAAVRDADAAIALRAGLGKAFSTKGAALERLGRLDEAVLAYRAGLEAEPANATLAGNLQQLEARIRARVAGRGANAGGGGRQADFPEAPALEADALRPASTAWRAVQAARVVMLFLLVAYLLPLGGAAPRRAYQALLLLAAVTHVAVLVIKYGLPAPVTVDGCKKWLFDPARGIMKDSSLPLIFLPLLFLTAGRPVVAAPFAIALVDLWYAAEAMALLLPGAAAQMVIGLGTSAAARLTGRTAEQLRAQAERPRRTLVLSALLDLAALFEVGCAVLALLELVLPQRNLMLALVQWQSFVLRYPMSVHVRRAFALLDSRAEAALSHRLVPAFCMTGLNLVRKFLKSYVVDPRNPPRGTGPNSPLSQFVGAAGRAVTAAQQRCAVS